MKKITIVSLLVIGSVFLAACGAAAPAEEAAAGPKVVHIVGDSLGDKSFIDSAHRGLTQSVEEFGIELVTLELGGDSTKLEPAFIDTIQDPETDFIVLGSWDLLEAVTEYAPQYPDVNIIFFDVPFDFDSCDCGNVYAIQYKQNEGSYLVGYYAALMSETGIIGAVGGQDIPVINDFFAGYLQGAADGGITAENVLIQYAGTWSDPAKGKELALTMYQQGADIVFQVAGGTGEGVFYAAEEAGKWSVGVDSDQALIIEETAPEQAATILTSMLKNVDKSLYRTFKKNFEGTLVMGQNEPLGIPEEGVGLAYNKYYDEATPQDVKDAIATAEAAIVAGEIIVDTAY
jgi:basic membrane protein A and related proteins